MINKCSSLSLSIGKFVDSWFVAASGLFFCFDFPPAWSQRVGRQGKRGQNNDHRRGFEFRKRLMMDLTDEIC